MDLLKWACDVCLCGFAIRLLLFHVTSVCADLQSVGQMWCFCWDLDMWRVFLQSGLNVSLLLIFWYHPLLAHVCSQQLKNPFFVLVVGTDMKTGRHEDRKTWRQEDMKTGKTWRQGRQKPCLVYFLATLCWFAAVRYFYWPAETSTRGMILICFPTHSFLSISKFEMRW